MFFCFQFIYANAFGLMGVKHSTVSQDFYEAKTFTHVVHTPILTSRATYATTLTNNISSRQSQPTIDTVNRSQNSLKLINQNQRQITVATTAVTAFITSSSNGTSKSREPISSATTITNTPVLSLILKKNGF